MIYIKLFFEFFKIGLFTFGGGYAMLPLITDAAVSNGWMTDEQLLEAGVQPDLIRFSVGIENADDIIADLEQALA